MGLPPAALFTLFFILAPIFLALKGRRSRLHGVGGRAHHSFVFVNEEEEYKKERNFVEGGEGGCMAWVGELLILFVSEEEEKEYKNEKE